MYEKNNQWKKSFGHKVEENDDYTVYLIGEVGYVPFGKLTVFKRDTRGEVSGKAGTSLMKWTETLPDGTPCPKPRPIELRKKYREW